MLKQEKPKQRASEFTKKLLEIKRQIKENDCREVVKNRSEDDKMIFEKEEIETIYIVGEAS